MRHIFFICLFWLSSLFCHETSWVVIETIEYPYSWIVFILEQGTGKEYVLKQIKDPDPKEQLSILIEVLVGEIGQEASIPINSVRLIEVNELSNIKILPYCAASLLSKAKGCLLEKSEKWCDLEIGQRIRPPGSAQYKKYGPLPPERTGLTWEVVQHMSRHHDLPPLVALDTFVGNRDRWENNLFYDEETDSFTGIDQGESYKNNLMAVALRNMVGSKLFTEEDRSLLPSLISFTQTLETLVETWPKERIVSRLTQLSETIPIDLNSSPMLQKYLQCIENSCHVAPNLLKALHEKIEVLQNLQKQSEIE